MFGPLNALSFFEHFHYLEVYVIVDVAFSILEEMLEDQKIQISSFALIKTVKIELILPLSVFFIMLPLDPDTMGAKIAHLWYIWA